MHFSHCESALSSLDRIYLNGPLARYVILCVAHAPGMPGTFSPPSWISDSDMHHGTCVTHVPWCMPGSLNSCFIWIRWRGKCSRHSRRMRNPQFYVSGKRSITINVAVRSLSRLPCHRVMNQRELILKIVVSMTAEFPGFFYWIMLLFCWLCDHIYRFHNPRSFA